VVRQDDLRYDGCDRCLFDGTKAICCCTSRIALALHRLALEIPLIRLIEPKEKTCEWFENK